MRHIYECTKFLINTFTGMRIRGKGNTLKPRFFYPKIAMKFYNKNGNRLICKSQFSRLL